MSNKRHTCNKCQHYTPDSLYANMGSCALMGDSNDHEYDRDTNMLDIESDRAYGWDYESYKAGVYVTPKFGCIHWAKKQPTTTGATA
jgi:hypothetical protein